MRRNPTPLAALRAWDAAKASSSDPRLEVFRHAILAPNPHNRQPWQIELVGQDEAVISCDLDRNCRRPIRSIARSPSDLGASWNWHVLPLPSAD